MALKMGSSAVALGLRRSGSGGARRGAGRKPALPGDFDWAEIGGECEQLLRQERTKRANEARQRVLASVEYEQSLAAVHRLPLEVRAEFIRLDLERVSPDEVQRLKTEAIPADLSPGDETEALQAIDDFTSALEAMRDNRQSFDGTIEDGRSPEDKPIGRLFPGELPIPKSEIKGVRRQIIEAVFHRYKESHPNLTLRAIADAWREVKRFQRS